MAWFRIVAGGQNHPVEINFDDVSYVTYADVGEHPDIRTDAILHMRDGRTFTVDPDKWARVLGRIVDVTEEEAPRGAP